VEIEHDTGLLYWEMASARGEGGWVARRGVGLGYVFTLPANRRLERDLGAWHAPVWCGTPALGTSSVGRGVR